MMWLRQLAMDLLVLLIDRLWETRHTRRLQGWHASLLQAQMAARRKAGKVEVKTGIHYMTDEELDEYGRRF